MIILQMKGVLLLHVFVIVDDDYKISSFPISQTVGRFVILSLCSLSHPVNYVLH